MEKKIAVFDACGTITKTNNTFDFINYVLKKDKFFRFIIFKIFLLFSIIINYTKIYKLIKRDIIREWSIGLLKNFSVDLVGKRAKEYIEVISREYLNEEIIRMIDEEKKNKDKVMIVSSSINPPIKELAKILNIEYVSSELEEKEGRYTGKLKKDLKREGIDILYCPSVAAPIFYKRKIITIHDCAALRFKDEAGLFSRLYLKLVFLSAKYFSLGIVTISDFAKKEIIELLNIPKEKITVISEGAPFLVDIDDNILKIFLAKFNLFGQKYFFYISNLRPRKNVVGLLSAWTDFSSRHPDYSLVIAGKNDNFKLNSDRVIFLGIVSEEEKVALYKGSIALVFPSLYEGFGLPILEAQKLGIPVISSNSSSLPEVAGDGSLFFNPYDTKDICLSLEKIIDSSFNREDIISKGYKNIARFSWDKTALTLLKLIKK